MREKLVLQIRNALRQNPEHLGARVGVLCVEAGVPVALAQQILVTSHVSVYRWFCAETTPSNIHDKQRLKRLEYCISKALDDELLPNSNASDVEMAGFIAKYWAESKKEVAV
jgi:hypothetical protein